MVHAPSVSAETQRQQPSPDPLLLRIVGGRRDGHCVRLTARKCTIGADRNCTLRIRAYGVRPVHCLIVRGPRTTVIRRWSGDTLLNNHTFSDAPLMPGDRIRVGPIELEVVAVEAESLCPARDDDETADADPRQTAVLGDLQDSAPRPATTDEREQLLLVRRTGHARARRLVSEIRQARQQAAQAVRRVEDQQSLAQHTREAAAEIERQQRSVRRQEEQWEATHRQAKAHLTRRLTEVQAKIEQFEREQAQWHEACEKFASERAEWESQRDQAKEAIRQREQQLDRREQRLESDRSQPPVSSGESTQEAQSAAAKIHKLEDRQQQLQQELEQAVHESATMRAEAEQLRLDNQNHQAREQADHAKLLEQELHIARLQEELHDAQIAPAVERKTSVQGPRAQSPHAQQLAEREEAVLQREQALQSRQEALVAELQEFEQSSLQRRAALDARQADVERQLTQQLEMLKADRADFERQREELIESSQSLEAQRRQWRVRIEQTEAELTRRQRELDHLRSTLELERGELHEWQHEMDRRRRPNVQDEVTLADAGHASNPDRGRKSSSQTAQGEEPASQSVAQTGNQGVFARLLDLTRTPEMDSTNAVSEGPPQVQSPDISSATSTPGAPSGPNAGPLQQPNMSTGEEASIEGYMSRLMHEGNGNQGTLDPALPPTSGQEASIDRPTSSHPDLADVSPLRAAALQRSLPMQPRHLAPEMSSNIAAMRELANFHARSARERDQLRRRLTLAATGKLIVAVFAATVGTIALMWPNHPRETWYYAGAISALTVAMFWGLQCALLARSVGRVRQSWLPQSEAITPDQDADVAAADSPLGGSK